MWWSRSVVVALEPYLNTGAETSSAGKTTCSAPHTSPRCAAVATGPESPTEARSPRAAPQAVPYPQWTRLENRASAPSSSGSTFRTFSAASAGVWLALRPLSFISSVLDTVITAVPATPANIPLPTFAAMSPILVLIGCSFLAVCISSSSSDELVGGYGKVADECACRTKVLGDGLPLGKDILRVECAACDEADQPGGVRPVAADENPGLAANAYVDSPYPDQSLG